MSFAMEHICAIFILHMNKVNQKSLLLELRLCLTRSSKLQALKTGLLEKFLILQWFRVDL